MNDWLEFKARVIQLMNSRGHNFLRSVTHPNPAAPTIDDWYSVPVETGPEGYVTQHGAHHVFAEVQPAK